MFRMVLFFIYIATYTKLPLISILGKLTTSKLLATFDPNIQDNIQVYLKYKTL